MKKECTDSSKSELEEFVYIISHDLQVPLRGINSYVEMLNDTLNDHKSDSAILMEKIHKNSAQLKTMLDGLLALSRIKKSTFELAKVNIYTQLAKALEIEKLQSAGFSYSLTGDELCYGVLDLHQLDFMISCLLTNSLKFRKDSEDVHISVEVKNTEEGPQFQFRDNGIGIAEKYYSKIFKPFQKVHAYSAYPGVGLGLTYTKKIVDEHAGTITIDSTLGKGTMFTVFFPKGPSGHPNLP
ncbi:MAG: HAMP domain-containing sensor histidine kinase [Chlamydiota bacterium]|nr:HAMP domain-containing sensor histidine kinase [Chlamydiota bacterium]